MSKLLNEIVQHNVELRPYNTLNIEAQAQSFAAIHSVEQLQTILDKKDDHISVFVLGGGSNILFANDFNGIVLKVSISGIEVLKENDKHVWVQIGAGENWHETVKYAVQKGWGGIENLSLIPGTVGAAPIQNIGAYGVELKDVFDELQAVEIATGATRSFSKEECQFGYRDSIFKGSLKGKFVIAKVVLKLDKKPKLETSYGAIKQELANRNIENPTIRDISDIVIDIRNHKLPHPDNLGNAGSFFKNPVITVGQYEKLQQSFAEIPGYPVDEDRIKVPAGWLIEEAGWKGKVMGDAGTYKQQALVIVNHGEASANDILELARAIQQTVKEQFNINLVPEVNIIG
jgi:UDP-N-acetylmuramate dehydrogenase